MNLLDVGLGPIRRMMRPTSVGPCFICRRPIHRSEDRLRLRGDTLVHRRCATYRLRNRPTDSRLGFPGR
jgi:hypothetical protein